MKRAFDLVTPENNTSNEDIQNDSKRQRDELTTVELMDYTDKPHTSLSDIEFRQALVERNPNPSGYGLVNAEYVGKKSMGVLSDLEAYVENAADFTAANVQNRLDVIGQQMRSLENSLYDVLNKAKRDSDLHSAACNFVKKAGNMYHLYERPSGQKYFSMLSPEDWNGNPPHLFLGSWYLEADQSWTSSKDMHLRYPGINFLKQLYMGMKSIQ